MAKISNQYQFQVFHFLYPKIKPIITKESQESIENYLISNDINIQENFDENRKIGENDSYLCSIIRNDSCDEFIVYVNQTNLSLNMTIINPSIFETNLFLLDKKPTLIEYASFYGSIQIFKYLLLNNVELSSSLWLYSIHGQNAEIISILEENHIEPPSNSYQLCFEEAIKCHHNEIADYIMVNYLDQDECLKKAYFCTIMNCNFYFFPDDFGSKLDLFYLHKFNYNEFVDIYLETKKEDIEKKEDTENIEEDTQSKKL